MGKHSRKKNHDQWVKTTENSTRAEKNAARQELLDDMIELADGAEDLPVYAPQTETAEEKPKAALEQEPDLADRAEDALKAFAARLPEYLRRFCRFLRQSLHAVGNFLYEVGYYTEYGFVRFGRAFVLGASAAGAALLKALSFLLKVLLWLPATILMMLARPFVHLFHACRSIRDILFTRDPDRPGETWKKVLVYLWQGLRKHTHLLFDILGWVLPVAAAALFVFTVRTVMDYEYVLQLSYDDQVLGYVYNEDTFEKARQNVRSRIVYTEEDSGGQWSLQPTYMLAVNDGVEVMNASEVADAILETSGEEIVEATGFYLNGHFYGAVIEADRLRRELDEIKAPYATGEEGEYITFVEEPQLIEGVYLRSSVVDYAAIGDLIHSQVAGEVRYTVKDGDNPSGIAHAHGLTTAELVNLNADQNILKSLHPGDSLLVSQAVPFLRVKVVYRRTEMEEIPFETSRKNTPDLYFGSTKTVVRGVPGLKECVYDYEYVDGIQQSKTLVSSTVITAPVTQEILVGTQVRPGVTAVPSTGAYMWPIPGYSYCSRGFTGVHAHNGIDICGGVGTPIYATQSGVISKTVYGNRGYGIYVMVDHGGGMQSLYGHCSGLAVQVGQWVNQGDLIAYLGNTGNSTGPHCHFEIIVNGTRVNPATYVGNG